MYALYDRFTLTGQHHIRTWDRQGHSWAAFTNYRQPAAHGLYIPQPVLNLIIRGEKRIYDGLQVHHLRTGDVFLIPAGSVICSEILRPAEDFASINFFLPEMLQAAQHTGAGTGRQVAGTTLTISPSADWRQLTQALLQHFREDGAMPAYENMMDRLQHLLQKEPVAVRRAVAGKPSGGMQHMMARLHNGIHEVRLLEEVASLGNMSPATLKRRFRETYQCSPMQWIWGKRLQMSALLLRTSEQPIPEIAYSTGFEDLSHFYRQFRRCFGMTPARWRRAEI
ncbi:helix-turn-helix transcriptional regulator [Chitinophaga qingshengii]|uniref:Helix-turn-helix transcriptional regulator n=1 Tax=Chitinophaga qingshengii TaxID=1569794 RepID=A0ABR7TNM2_9BACT|nr:AraC family transcriptional regulator [Chitinophaga qingshengii]MBC9931137.1 helix-turn-helix transcriptional regulator [Chitinophaga qingshengii]